MTEMRFPEPREVPRQKTIYLPHNPWLEIVCPMCRSLTTEWHPAEHWGRCQDCGATWITVAWDDDRIDASALFERLDRKTRDLVEHVVRHQPRFRSRVSFLLQQGAEVSYDEIAQWHKMIHEGYRTPEVKRAQ